MMDICLNNDGKGDRKQQSKLMIFYVHVYSKKIFTNPYFQQYLQSIYKNILSYFSSIKTSIYNQDVPIALCTNHRQSHIRFLIFPTLRIVEKALIFQEATVASTSRGKA